MALGSCLVAGPRCCVLDVRPVGYMCAQCSGTVEVARGFDGRLTEVETRRVKLGLDFGGVDGTG